MEHKQRDIIIVQYPFSDFSAAKVRPAIVISNNAHNKIGKDLAVVPLTTNLSEMNYSFLLDNKDLESGKLLVKSRVRVDRIFSVDKQIVKTKVAHVKEEILDKILGLLFELTKKETAA